MLEVVGVGGQFPWSESRHTPGVKNVHTYIYAESALDEEKGLGEKKTGLPMILSRKLS